MKIKILTWENYLINILINGWGNKSRILIKRWTNESIDKAKNDEINKWIKAINKWKFLCGKMIWLTNW